MYDSDVMSVNMVFESYLPQTIRFTESEAFQLIPSIMCFEEVLIRQNGQPQIWYLVVCVRDFVNIEPVQQKV